MLNPFVNQGPAPQGEGFHLLQEEGFTAPWVFGGMMGCDLGKVELALAASEKFIGRK
jgi:hypothetical protein